MCFNYNLQKCWNFISSQWKVSVQEGTDVNMKSLKENKELTTVVECKPNHFQSDYFLLWKFFFLRKRKAE